MTGLPVRPVFVVVLLLSVLSRPGSAAPDPGPTVVSAPVAVFPLRNATGDAGLDWVGVGLQDSLTVDLWYVAALHTKALPQMTELLQSVCPDPTLACVAGQERATWQKQAKAHGYGGFLWGEYRRSGKALVLRLGWYGPDGNAPRAERTVRGASPPELLAAASEGLRALLAARGIAVTDAERARMQAPKTRVATAWERNAVGYWEQIRYDLAADEAQRAARATVWERHLRAAVAADPDYAEAWNNLGWQRYTLEVYAGEGAALGATAAFEQALRLKPELIDARVGRGATWQALDQGAAALPAYEKAVALNPSQDAEEPFHRALVIDEQVHGPDHPATAGSLNSLAALYRTTGRYAEAEPLYRRALAIREKALGPDHPATAQPQQPGRVAARPGPHCRGRATPPPRPGGNQSRIFSELLRQGDVRRLSRDPAFLQLKEQWQSLLIQRGNLREKRATLPITAPRYDDQKTDLTTRIDALSAELAAVEARLWRDYPRYMELLDIPRPVIAEQLQTELLRPGEALLSVVLLAERTVLLIVTRDRFALHIAPLTPAAITQHARALRHGLTGRDLSSLQALDPADLHALYQGLIAPVEPLLAGAARILVVADGPLYSLPLELLITAYDKPRRRAFARARRLADGRADHPLLSEYADLPYLADHYALRYLPSLAALAAQRRYPKPPVPITRPLIAFADPIFGQPEDASPSETRGHSPATQQTLALLARSGANPAILQRLPDSADEARAIAALVPGDCRLYLRQDAQEHTVKALSERGDLQGLRYLLFATHGLLAGEFRSPEPAPDPKADLTAARRPITARAPLGQPALALTLAPALHDEDGLLTLKDVIKDLDLNTDLVLLSACNTAGDSAKSNTGEGFAGLTRAFLFAGARHLWVSHWPVHSAAARDLTTAAIRPLQAGEADSAVALAQAQRTLRARVAPINADALGQTRYLAYAHPLFWASFVAVGD